MKRSRVTLASPYYPPRAGARSRATWPMRAGWRRLRLLSARIPAAATVRREVLTLLVPGMIFIRVGWPRLGRALLGLWGLALLVFLAELGRPAANWAFMVLLSIHTTCVSQRFQPALAGRPLQTQLLIGLAIVGVMALLVYMPARSLVVTRIAMPLQTSRGAVVVKPGVAPTTIRRGDWLAYHIEDGYGRGLRIMEGIGFGPVVALPGDEVGFDEKACRVNGQTRPRLASMPASGVLHLATNLWLVWPEVGVNIHGGGADPGQALLNIALVRPETMIGRPFKRWFFRRQTLP